MINSNIKRSITAMKGTYYCPHCAKELTPLPGAPEAIVQNKHFWVKDAAGRIKCCTCNNVVRRIEVLE